MTKKRRGPKPLIEYDRGLDNWLGVDTLQPIDVSNNPLFSIDLGSEDMPGMRELDAMRDPRFFGHWSHYLFGITLAPYQQVIQRELWEHAFPMFIASRGAGKCQVASDMIKTSFGFREMGDLIPDSNPGDNILFEEDIFVSGEKGYMRVNNAWKNPAQKTVKLTTVMGYEMEVLEDHQLRVVSGGQVVWKFAKDLCLGDTVPIARDESWFENTNNLGGLEAYNLGLRVSLTGERIPKIVLSAKKESVKRFLEGLMGEDFSKNTKHSFGSEKLNQEVQNLLLSFGVVSSRNGLLLDIVERDRNFDKIDKIENGFEETIGFQLEQDHSYFSNGFVSHNSFNLALFALSYALFIPNSKVVLAGASFRQSKMIFEYVDKMWKESGMLRSMCRKGDGAKRGTDQWVFQINSSTITAIPIGPTGEKIRGLRANVTICDEFAAHNPQIVEEVIFGFGAVANDPIANVKKQARLEYLKDQGLILESSDDDSAKILKNKSIISGTADYYFNHFYDYWQRYKNIIESGGNVEILEQYFPEGVPDAFDWRDFSVIRIPYSMLPKGYMADEVVARARTQMTKSLYLKEYEAIFVEDSDGFFKRSLIEKCVAKDSNLGELAFCDRPFEVQMVGNKKSNYVVAVDPAKERDNFALVVLEVFEDHSRIVYCWTTNEKDFKKRQVAGHTKEQDYYTFCAKKIRQIVKSFPTAALGIDAQGGGATLIERLKDKVILKPGEQPIYEVIDYDDPKPTDRMEGRHIIHSIQFAKAQWLSEANWGLKSDLEAGKILFPNFDALTVELSIAEDKIKASKIANSFGQGHEVIIFDSREDCAEELETLKDELTNIVYSKTSTGRERWDVPETMTENNKKVAGKKDRYSALIIANWLARKTRLMIKEDRTYEIVGGLVREVSTPSRKSQKTNLWDLYEGNQWRR